MKYLIFIFILNFSGAALAQQGCFVVPDGEFGYRLDTMDNLEEYTRWTFTQYTSDLKLTIEVDYDDEKSFFYIRNLEVEYKDENPLTKDKPYRHQFLHYQNFAWPTTSISLQISFYLNKQLKFAQIFCNPPIFSQGLGGA